MQEPKAERDADLITAFNAAINDDENDEPASASQSNISQQQPASSLQGFQGSGGVASSDLASLLSAALASAGAPPAQVCL